MGEKHANRSFFFISTFIRLNPPGRELAELRKISPIDWLVDYRVTFSTNGAKAIIDIATVVLSREI
jgi:hypothetical protein